MIDIVTQNPSWPCSPHVLLLLVLFGDSCLASWRQWIRERDVFGTLLEIVRLNEMTPERRIKVLDAFETWCFCSDDPHFRYYATLHMWYADVVAEQKLARKNTQGFTKHHRDFLFWREALVFERDGLSEVSKLARELFRAKTSIGFTLETHWQVRLVCLEKRKRVCEETLYPSCESLADEVAKMDERLRTACLTDTQQREEVARIRRELWNPKWTRLSLLTAP